MNRTQNLARTGLGLCLCAAALHGGLSEETPIRDRPQTWAQPVALDGAPNLFRVSHNLYRSGQPSHHGFAQLAEQGCRTVVNLRWSPPRPCTFADSPLTSVHHRLHAYHPTSEELVPLLRLLAEPSSAPILVHCQAGSDRTGLVIAAHRIVNQGWTKAEAIAEMRYGGFGFHRMCHNLVRFLEEMDVPRVRAQLDAQASPAQHDPSPALEIGGGVEIGVVHSVVT